MLNPLGLNKRRLYIAYYSRRTTSSDPYRYHSGLLTFRKDSKSNATIFHATTSPGAPWRFEAKNIAPRTMRLVCLLYIGKLDPAVTDDVLVELLGKLPLNNVGPEWTCLDWMVDALMVLISTGVMDPLPSPCSPAKLWEVGAQYADHWRATYNNNRELIGVGTPIPCCDTFGNPLPSPLS